MLSPKQAFSRESTLWFKNKLAMFGQPDYSGWFKQVRRLFALFGQVSTEPPTHGAKGSYIFFAKLRLVKSVPFE